MRQQLEGIAPDAGDPGRKIRREVLRHKPQYRGDPFGVFLVFPPADRAGAVDQGPALFEIFHSTGQDLPLELLKIPDSLQAGPVFDIPFFADHTEPGAGKVAEQDIGGSLFLRRGSARVPGSCREIGQMQAGGSLSDPVCFFLRQVKGTDMSAVLFSQRPQYVRCQKTLAPGAAQTSYTVSEPCSPAASTASMELSSWTVHNPPANPGSLLRSDVLRRK